MMRLRSPAYEGVAFVSLALAAWLAASAWLLTLPAAAAWMFTVAAILLLVLSAYNEFLLHQGLPPSRVTAVMEQIVALGIILVPTVQPVGLVAMANAIIVGATVFALAGMDLTDTTPTRTVAARSS